MKRVCSAPGCPALAPCPTHTRPRRSGKSRGWKWSKEVVPKVLARDRHRCVLCGRPCPHPRHHDVDHILPRARGGSDAYANLRTVCASRNRGGECLGQEVRV